MQPESKSKSFAFKLATEAKPSDKQQTWKVRDGVAVAGCTDPARVGDFRADYDIWGIYRGRDKGYWC